MIEEKYFDDFMEPPTKLTICIKASYMKIIVNGTKQRYRDLCRVILDIVHAFCGDAHVGGVEKEVNSIMIHL